MSMSNQHTSTLKEMIAKHQGCELAVIDTFYKIISNDFWDSKDKIAFLESAKGISGIADCILNKYIAFEMVTDSL